MAAPVRAQPFYCILYKNRFYEDFTVAFFRVFNLLFLFNLLPPGDHSRLAMVDVLNGKMYYHGNDQLGTPQIMTDSTNIVVWEGEYKPFGEVIWSSKNGHLTI